MHGFLNMTKLNSIGINPYPIWSVHLLGLEKWKFSSFFLYVYCVYPFLPVCPALQHLTSYRTNERTKQALQKQPPQSTYWTLLLGSCHCGRASRDRPDLCSDPLCCLLERRLPPEAATEELCLLLVGATALLDVLVGRVDVLCPLLDSYSYTIIRPQAAANLYIYTTHSSII